MDRILKKRNRKLSLSLSLSLLLLAVLYYAFFAIVFCYSLGKYNGVREAFSHSIKMFVPLIPILIVTSILLLKEIKTNK